MRGPTSEGKGETSQDASNQADCARGQCLVDKHIPGHYHNCFLCRVKKIERLIWDEE